MAPLRFAIATCSYVLMAAALAAAQTTEFVRGPGPVSSPAPAMVPSPTQFQYPAPASDGPAPSMLFSSTDGASPHTTTEPTSGVWTLFGQCSVPCGGGTQTRTCQQRGVPMDDKFCDGDSTQDCNSIACPPTEHAETPTRPQTTRAAAGPSTTTQMAAQPTTTTTTTTTTRASAVTRPVFGQDTTAAADMFECTNSCNGVSCSTLRETSSCLSLSDAGCYCEQCFTSDSAALQDYTPVYKCSRTTCAASLKIAQPCTHAQPCSMVACARSCTQGIDDTANGGGYTACTHFFSMQSGGCILSNGCNETRTTGEVGATYAKTGSAASPTSTDAPVRTIAVTGGDFSADSCQNRCNAEAERDHLDWCSCRSDCGEYVNGGDCCSDYEEECPFTLPPTTTTTSADPFPGEWGEWGDCTASCGAGKAFRACDSGDSDDCEGSAHRICNSDGCPAVTTTHTTTRSQAKNTCVGRCGDGPDAPGDCICTDECTAVFEPDECCSDFYARCAVDHSNSGDDGSGDGDLDSNSGGLVDPNQGVPTDTGDTTTGDPAAGTDPEATINVDDDDTLLLIVGMCIGGIVLIVVIVVVVRCVRSPRKNVGYQQALAAPGRAYAATMINHVEMQSVSTPRAGDDFVTI